MIDRRWRWPVGWAAVIVIATSVPVPAVAIAPSWTDLAVHAALYAVLAFLVYHAVEGNPRRRMLVTIAGCAAFGAADELHQIAIPGRAAELVDLVADAVGATAGALVAAGWHVRRSL